MARNRDQDNDRQGQGNFDNQDQQEDENQDANNPYGRASGGDRFQDVNSREGTDPGTGIDQGQNYDQGQGSNRGDMQGQGYDQGQGYGQGQDLEQNQGFGQGQVGDRYKGNERGSDLDYQNQESNNDRGNPGGGVGRTDETGRSGVYPASDVENAPSDSQLTNQAQWGQGDRGAAGANDSGQSELTNYWDERRRGENEMDRDEGKKNDER